MSDKFPNLALVAKQKINNDIECIGPWCHLTDFSNGDYSGVFIKNQVILILEYKVTKFE
jgi:hypothetical protein